jgi:phage tail-like protein
MANSANTSDDSPYAQYNFEVLIDGESVAGFSEVSGIAMELDTVQYQEGGVDQYVHQLPDQFAHANLVLQRGLTKDVTFWEWIQDVMSGTVTRKNVTVKIQKNFMGPNTWGWQFLDAYPTVWRGPDLVGGQGQGVAIETIELAYRQFNKLSGMPK